jgi:hypothetical protein
MLLVEREKPMSAAAMVENRIGSEDTSHLQTIHPGWSLPVSVIVTTMNWSRRAFEKAGQMANQLHVGIEIIAIRVVPYPLPLDRPPVPCEFIVRRLEEIAGNIPAPVAISVCCCRDPLEALNRRMNPKCPIIMAAGNKWRLNHDQRLARRLRRAGYNIVLVESE